MFSLTENGNAEYSHQRKFVFLCFFNAPFWLKEKDYSLLLPILYAYHDHGVAF